MQSNQLNKKTLNGLSLWVPKSQPLDLMFFRKMFQRLQERKHVKQKRRVEDLLDDDDISLSDIPLLDFHRAMSRLFLTLRLEIPFDARTYDIDGNGAIGWWEFVRVWNEQHISVNLSLLERVFITFEDPSSSIISRFVTIVLVSVIAVSSCCFVFATVPDLQQEPENDPDGEPKQHVVFGTIEAVCVVIFTCEYLIRLVAAPAMRKELIDKEVLLNRICDDGVIQWQGPRKRLLNFLLGPANIVDLLSIIPFWLELASGSSEGGSMVVLRLIRMVRVTRAVRIGKYLDAVSIIKRTMSRSLRALYVLGLLLIGGVVIFGSMIYFAEAGKWDPETHTYLRKEGVEWDDSLRVFVDVFGESPFRSIPSSFWWALVTATTVGYGDEFPTTQGGKTVAALCMIWSLVVLALPVGIIGSTFDRCWVEYDEEKRLEVQVKDKQQEIIDQSMRALEPLAYARQIRIEVWHHERFNTKRDLIENNCFLGELTIEMELNDLPETARVTANLQGNCAKGSCQASGKITVECSWTPRLEERETAAIRGTLDVTVVRAEGLLNLDWKRGGMTDPFARVTLYPCSPIPDDNGKFKLVPQVWETQIVEDSVNPHWNEQKSFAFLWTENGIEATQNMASQAVKNFSLAAAELETQESSTNSANAPSARAHSKTLPAPLPQSKTSVVDEAVVLEHLALIPKIAAELSSLREAVNQIQRGQVGVQQTPPSVPLPVGAPPPLPSGSIADNGSKKQPQEAKPEEKSRVNGLNGIVLPNTMIEKNGFDDIVTTNNNTLV